MAKVNVDLSQLPSGQSSRELRDSKAAFADRIDLLRARAGILSHRDRALMQMYLEGGYSFIKMARLTGVNEGKIARRIRKLIPRLVNSEYITCIRHRNRFSSLEQTIAKDYFVEGCSVETLKRHA